VFADRISVNVGWIAYHESARDSARVRVVVDALLAYFETNAAMYSGVPAGPGTQ
jgi:hypothetical protein